MSDLTDLARWLATWQQRRINADRADPSVSSYVRQSTSFGRSPLGFKQLQIVNK